MSGYLKFRHAALAAGIGLTLGQAGCAQVEAAAAPDGYQVLDPADIVGEFTGDPEASLICQTLSEIAADPPADLFRQYEGPEDRFFGPFEAYGYVFFEPSSLGRALSPADASIVTWEPMTLDERSAAYWDVFLDRASYKRDGRTSGIGSDLRLSPQVEMGTVTRDSFLLGPPEDYVEKILEGPDLVYRVPGTGYEIYAKSSEEQTELLADTSFDPVLRYVGTRWRRHVYLTFENYQVENFTSVTAGPYIAGSNLHLLLMESSNPRTGRLGGLFVLRFDPSFGPTDGAYTSGKGGPHEQTRVGPWRPERVCSVHFQLVG